MARAIDQLGIDGSAQRLEALLEHIRSHPDETPEQQLISERTTAVIEELLSDGPTGELRKWAEALPNVRGQTAAFAKAGCVQQGREHLGEVCWQRWFNLLEGSVEAVESYGTARRQAH